MPPRQAHFQSRTPKNSRRKGQPEPVQFLDTGLLFWTSRTQQVAGTKKNAQHSTALLDGLNDPLLVGARLNSVLDFNRHFVPMTPTGN
jgi:hypothetical protein